MSQSVDTKIVELRFDNNNFEDKVDSTLTKLQNLNKTIDEKGLSKSLLNLGKNAKSVDMSGITDGVEEVTKSFSKMEIFAVTAFANISNSVVNLGKKLLSNLISPITKGGLTRAMNIQQAGFQLEGLNVQKSAGHENLSYYHEVMEAVLGTAYSYDVAAKAASQLATSNIGVTETTITLADGSTKAAKVMNDDMTEALLAIAGVSAMSGAQFDQIADIFLNAAGKGAVMGDEFRRLSINSINGYQIMADYLGKTQDEVRKMASAGEISFDVFAKAMREAFGDHAKDSTLIFTGAVEDIKAALARIGADFYEPALNAARDVLNSLTPLVDVIHNYLNPYLKETGNLMDVVSKRASQAFDFLSYGLQTQNGNDAAAVDWIYEHVNSWTNLMDAYTKDTSAVYDAIHGLYEYGITVDGVTHKIRGFTMIADYLGITVDEVKEKVANGTIGFNIFYKAFRKLYGQSDELRGISGISQAFDDYIIKASSAGEETDEFQKHIHVFNSICEGTKTIVEALKVGFGGLFRIFMTLMQHLAPLGTLFVETTKVLAEFIVTIADFIATNETFSNVLDSIVNLLEKVFSVLSLNKTVPLILGAITKAFDFLANAVERLYDGLGKIVTAFNNTMGKIIDKILEVISSTETLREILENLKTAGIIVIVLQLIDQLTKPAVLLENIAKSFESVGKSFSGMIKNIGKVFESIAGMVGKVGKVIDEITDTLHRMQELIIATAVLEIAFAIAVLAGALYLLSKVKLTNASEVLSFALAIGALGGTLFGITKMFGTLKTTAKIWEKTTNSIKDIGKAMLMLSISIAILAGSIYVLSKIDSGKLLKATGAVEVLLITLAAVAWLLSGNSTTTKSTGLKALWSGKSTKTSKNMTKGIIGVVAIAEAVKILAKALTEVASISDPQKMYDALTIIEILMWSMTGIIKILSGDQAAKMTKGALTLIAMALAVRMLVKPIKELSQLEAEPMLMAAATIAGLMFVMTMLLNMLSDNKGLVKASIGVLIMAAAIKVLEGTVVTFAGLDAESMWQAIIGIAAALGAVTLALSLVDPDGLIAKSIAFLAVAAALGKLSEVVMLFGSDTEVAWGGIAAVGGALAILAGACWLFDKVPLGGILKLFLTLALGAVIVAGFGAAIGVFGVGLTLFAAGLSAMADAVKQVSDVGGEFIIFMAAFVVGLMMLTSLGLPAVGVILALGLAFLMLGAGIALIGSGVSNIAAAVKLISELDGQLGSAAKSITSFVKELKKMDSDAEAVGKSATTMADALKSMGTAAQTAARKIDGVAKAGENIAKTFAKGIISNTPVVEKAATDMVNKTVAKFRNNYNQWYSVGSYLATGLINGLASKKAAVEAKARELGNAAEKALREAAKVKSPSRVWMQIGNYMGEGLAIGITKSSNEVVSASQGLAAASEMAVSSAIASISKAVSEDMDTSPVITPVVDLSEVRSGASFINSAFGSLNGIRGNGLAASITHTIQNGGKSDVERSIDGLTDQIGAMTDTMNSRALNNYITVDGAADPEAFADGLIRSFRLNARTV